jgi:hypothetical protein
MDESRVRYLSSLMDQCVNVEVSTMPIITHSYDDTKKHARAIDAVSDSQLVVTKYRSGYAPPLDIPFDDFGNPAASNDNNLPDANGLHLYYIATLLNGNVNLGSNISNGGSDISDPTLGANRTMRIDSKASTLGRKQSGRTGKSISQKLFGGHKVCS